VVRKAVYTLLVAGLLTVGSAAPAAAAGGLGLAVTADPEKVRPGQQVTLTVTVSNEFDVAFGTVRVTADGAPGCARSNIGPVAAGASKTYTCAVTAGKRPGRQQVSLTAVAQTGYEKFTAEAGTAFKVKKPRPSSSPSISPSKHSKPKKPGKPSTSPVPTLPITGTPSVLPGLALAGTLLLAAGGVLVILTRRRERVE
jgi:LPXTG-motif cell wall-anchored protein